MNLAFKTLVFFLCLLISSCAYHWGFPKPQGVESIALEIFENNTFRRGVEIALSEKISNEIVERSGLKLSTRQEADAVLRGKIVQIQDQLLLSGPNNEARYAFVRIELEAELINSKTGKPIRKVKFYDKGEYLTDNLQTRETATNQALIRLAEKIVLSLCFGE